METLNNEFKSSIDIKNFNKALVRSVNRTSYSEKELSNIDKKINKLYQKLVLKRHKNNLTIKNQNGIFIIISF